MSKWIPKVKAAVSITPTGSHVVILSLVWLLALCLICTFLFIALSLNYWPPLVFAILLIVVIVLFWLLSHRHVDDKSLPPTQLMMKDGKREMTISSPPGGLPDRERMNHYERMITAFQHQRLLPKPDGLIDENGNPIPMSEEVAHRIVDEVNNQVSMKFEAMNLQPNHFDQPNKTVQSGPTIEPNLEEIKGKNKPSE